MNEPKELKNPSHDIELYHNALVNFGMHSFNVNFNMRNSYDNALENIMICKFKTKDNIDIVIKEPLITNLDKDKTISFVDKIKQVDLLDCYSRVFNKIQRLCHGNEIE